MYQNCCKKCGSISLHIENKGNNVGLYCNDCGAWIKWLSKDEVRAFNYANQVKNGDNISNDDKYTAMIDNLQKFISFLNDSIDAEMDSPSHLVVI